MVLRHFVRGVGLHRVLGTANHLAAVEVEGEVAGKGGAAVVVGDVLLDDDLGGDVVVGDGAHDVVALIGDHRVRHDLLVVQALEAGLRVARDLNLRHEVRRVGRHRVGDAAGHRSCTEVEDEVGHHRIAAVTVVDDLDHRDLRGDVVVGDGADHCFTRSQRHSCGSDAQNLSIGRALDGAGAYGAGGCIASLLCFRDDQCQVGRIESGGSARDRVAVHLQREVADKGVSAVVVDDALHHRQARRHIGVGDGAGDVLIEGGRQRNRRGVIDGGVAAEIAGAHHLRGHVAGDCQFVDGEHLVGVDVDERALRLHGAVQRQAECTGVQ